MRLRVPCPCSPKPGRTAGSGFPRIISRLRPDHEVEAPALRDRLHPRSGLVGRRSRLDRAQSSSTDLNSLRANHGELAQVHLAWEKKCDACHEPFKPINGRGLLSSTSSTEPLERQTLHDVPRRPDAPRRDEAVGSQDVRRVPPRPPGPRILDGPARGRRMHDLPLETCRPYRHEQETWRRQDVREVCTGFQYQGPPPIPARRRPAWQNDALQDKSKLKFNHALHMRKGIVQKEGDTPYTVERIPIEAERARYQKSGTLNDPVQLECARATSSTQPS